MKRIRMASAGALLALLAAGPAQAGWKGVIFLDQPSGITIQADPEAFLTEYSQAFGGNPRIENFALSFAPTMPSALHAGSMRHNYSSAASFTLEGVEVHLYVPYAEQAGVDRNGSVDCRAFAVKDHAGIFPNAILHGRYEASNAGLGDGTVLVVGAFAGWITQKYDDWDVVQAGVKAFIQALNRSSSARLAADDPKVAAFRSKINCKSAGEDLTTVFDSGRGKDLARDAMALLNDPNLLTSPGCGQSRGGGLLGME